jgi:hypothetical protein
MRYGIPDFKMEKHHIERRVEQMEAEGVTFHYNASISDSRDKSMAIRPDPKHDAVLYCRRRRKSARSGIPGMDLTGVHYAMPYLVQQNKRVPAKTDNPAWHPPIHAAASMWSSSGAATPRPTASAPHSARVAVGDAARHPAAAAGEGRQAGRLALLGDEDAHLLLAG